LIENSSKLFFARSKDGDPNLEILNGVRVLSMLWVILGHTYFYGLATALGNPLIALEFFKSFTFNMVLSGPYAVDIFFWLSGFLGVYILLGSTRKKNGKMENPFMIILHRYLRIVPLYVLTLFFFWFLMSAVGSGPIFFRFWETRAKACNSSWWVHLLFLNNIYEINHEAND
jgi:peptidoglycan/LPS O-acetylase OafA/YrhL